MKNEKINKEIINIWKEYSKDKEENMPLFYPDFNKNGILCIGCNPSLRKDFISMKFDEKDKNKINKLINEEKLCRLNRKDKYFGKFIELSEKINIKPDYLDLFLYRQLKQNEFKNKIFEEKKKGIKKNSILNKFGEKQIDLFINILEEDLAKPKIILVANAFVRYLLYERLKDKIIKSFEEKGYDVINLNNRNIPIFFSSMLSGGHLDNDSFDRLCWLIKKALKETKKD